MTLFNVLKMLSMNKICLRMHKIHYIWQNWNRVNGLVMIGDVRAFDFRKFSDWPLFPSIH